MVASSSRALACLFAALAATAAHASPSSHRPPATMALPLAFEANQGQTADAVRYIARGQGYALFLTRDEAVVRLHRPRAEAPDAVVRMRFAGADPAPAVAGIEPLAARANYLLGADARRWRTDVPLYARVRYAGVYPGVDAVFYGNERALEYDLVVAPGADPAAITLAFRGAERATIADDGTLVLHAPGGDLTQRKPVAHQTIDGVRRPVDAGFVLAGDADGERYVRFALGAYDAAYPLVIDPVLGYATYLGGPSHNEGRAITVDANGNAYVTGVTNSATFPIADGLPNPNNALQGSQDAFVTKLGADGGLVYSTYLGGGGSDAGNGIAVDDQGSAYVAGQTDSSDFPTVNPLPAPNNALQGQDGFVTKLGPNGDTIVYSTFLGGSASNEGATAIAVDGSRNAYVTGTVFSGDFPTAGTFANNTNHGVTDAFVAKLATNGSSLVYSLYLGGGGADAGRAIAVRSGEAYVTGRTQSIDFPLASGLPAPNNGLRGFSDGFVIKVNAAGSALVYSTYLSGSGDVDDGNAIAVDGSGNAYVGGKTQSANFLASATATGSLPAPNAAYRGGADGYVVKIAAAGTSVGFLAFLGGSSNGSADEVNGLALDANANVYVTGQTDTNDFPVVNGLPLQNRRGQNNPAAIVTKIAAAGNALLYSTYLGGTRQENGRAIAVGSGSAYVAGDTTSNDFSVKNAAQATHGSGDFNTDAFVAKIDDAAPPALAYTTGNVFLSAVDFGEVREYAPNGTFVRALPLPSGKVAGGTSPAGIAFDAANHLFVADLVQNAIFEFDATGGLVGTFASGINSAPQSLVFDGAGNLLVGTTQGPNDVLIFASNGTPGTPFDVFSHATGSLWIDLAADQRTLLFTSNAEDVATYDLVTRTQGDDVFLDADGIRDYGVRALPNGAFVANGDVVRVNTSGGVSKTYTAVPAASLFAVSRDPDDETLWSASEGIGNVTPGAAYAFNIASGAVVHQFTGPVGVDRVPVGGLAVFGELTEARNGAPPATPTPLPTLTPAPEICDDCIDNDVDGFVDRKDVGDCAPRANGMEQGLGTKAAGKAIAKCTKGLAKAGSKLAGSRQKHLQKCLAAVLSCVQLKPNDAKCTAKATATCAKEIGKLPGERSKLASGVEKACGAPLTVDDLKNTAGLGYEKELDACAARGVAALATVGDVASCVLAEHACRAESLVGTQVPRAAELLAAAGRNPGSEFPCLGASADGAGARLTAAAKAAVKCQRAITKAGAKLASARFKTFQKCAAAVTTCIQVKPSDAKCRTKAGATCTKQLAKLTAAGSGAAAKLAAAVGKGCSKAPLTVADVLAAPGLGFDARAGECAALEALPSGSLAALADCVARHHACRVDQMLENELPRLRELLAIAGVSLD